MVGGALPRWWGEKLAVAFLCIALALGGATGQGFWSDTIIQLASLAPIFVVAVLLAHSAPGSFGPLLFAAVVVALPSVQLVPLPPSLWSVLAGRSVIYESFIQAGVEPPWLPLSLSPETTLRSSLSLAPPIAVFLSAAFLGPRARRSMTFALLIFAGLSVGLGLAQVSGGPSSPLRFYTTTNASSAVGFFANRNHYCALLYSAAALLGAWVIRAVRKRGERLVSSLLLCFALYAVIIFAILSAGSRAGILLMILAGSGLVVLALQEADRWDVPALIRLESYSHLVGKLLIAAGGLAVSIVLLFGKSIVQFIESASVHEARFDIFRTAFTAAMSYMPFGAGFGTFASIYQIFEVPQRMTGEVINRAHNDWLEWWLEGGVPSIAVSAAFSMWFIAASTRVWRDAGQNTANFDQILARASTIVILLLAIHSLADYPLRTTAMACVFALACGNLIGYFEPRSVGSAMAVVEDGSSESATRAAAYETA